MPTPAQLARFRARVERDARFYSACRDRCGDRGLEYRLNALLKEFDELRKPPRELLSRCEVPFVPLALPERRDKPDVPSGEMMRKAAANNSESPSRNG